MTNHTLTTDTPIRELTDAELDQVIGGLGFGHGLQTALIGASPPAKANFPPLQEPVGVLVQIYGQGESPMTITALSRAALKTRMPTLPRTF